MKRFPDSVNVNAVAVRGGRSETITRDVPEEVPVALVYDATTYAVLMATPTDLEDLACGFSLTEGIVEDATAIERIEVVEQANGIEARIWLRGDASLAHLERRRAIVGSTGCGLCGVESLDAALPLMPRLDTQTTWTGEEIIAAVSALREHQPLGIRTRAVHAAGLWRDGALTAVREDVGRHNALDKLAGALIGDERLGEGLIVLTSRVSTEMVQKTARMGVAAIAAISAPTALAVRQAEAAGITLAAIVRDDGLELFAHGERVCGVAQPSVF